MARVIQQGVSTCKEELARLRHQLQVNDLADLDSSRGGDEAEQRQRREQGPRHDCRHGRCGSRAVTRVLPPAALSPEQCLV